MGDIGKEGGGKEGGGVGDGSSYGRGERER